MDDIEKYITDDMRQAMAAVRRQGLQNDLRVLTDRLRNEAPAGSPDFNAGIGWALLWLENTANTITKGDDPSMR
ncbi:hypothetical protein [Streptomyces sp. NBC_01465]|uniref:hypothetical protein n=1 Tax=Streptomyces sp. NBC_01465 TaxID=2903878 RepID=UPI002E3429F7|nr:hypothetical protein [Streptomyces sp. NBC_01465]